MTEHLRWSVIGTGDRYKLSRYCSILRALKRTLKDVPWKLNNNCETKIIVSSFLRNITISKGRVTIIFVGKRESRGYQMFLKERLKGQANKGAGRMPWHWEPMKDVISCDKLRGAANKHWSGDFWMRKLTWVHTQVRYTELQNRYIEGTAWTETSK